MQIKVAFEVYLPAGEGEPNKLVIEKQELMVEIDAAALMGPSVLDAARTVSDGADQFRAAKKAQEQFDAAGLVIGRFIESKLREGLRG